MKVLFTDHDYLDVALEERIFAAAGIELKVAQCRTAEDVVREGQGCTALLAQYAPLTAAVLSALPEVRLCSRLGAGYDTVDTEAAARLGVWVTNTPDYGVGEVALHALSLLLASIRNVVAYDRDIHSGTWHFSSAGQVPRAQLMTVGILGLGRIGKRFAHYAQPIFRRVVAHDPLLIDGDFPQYVERVGLDGALRDRRRDLGALPAGRHDAGTRGGASAGTDEARLVPGQHRARRHRRRGGAGGDAPDRSSGRRRSRRHDSGTDPS